MNPMTHDRYGELESLRGKAMALFGIFLLAYMLLVAPGWAAPSTGVNVFFAVNDSEGHAMPDAMVLVNYQTNGSVPELDGTRQGFTDVAGLASTALSFAPNARVPGYAYASAYTPFWSSDRLTLRIHESGDQRIEANFTVPLAFDTYRLSVEQNGTPVPGATVRMLEPMFAAKRTDQDGVAQFRFPRGGRVHGQVESGGGAQEFAFEAGNGSQPQIFNQTIGIPFENSTLNAANESRTFSVQMFDSASNLLTNKPFNVSAPGVEDTYFSDSNGIIYLREVPYDSLNMTWILHNTTYNTTIDTGRAPARIDTPVLLKIQPPDIASLGDDCYRIQINITDPRPDAIEQVVAKAKDSQDQLPFVMESSRAGPDSLNFQRVICVVEDTQFYISAADQYEEASMQIQLLKNNKRPEASPAVAFVIDRVPPVERKNIEDKIKVEYAVILAELLGFLVAIYVMLRFKNVAMYYLQMAIRAAYLILHARRPGKPADPKKGGNAGEEPRPPGSAS